MTNVNVIAHMTSVHPRNDSRIRLKEVASLARAFDCDVRLYVQDGLGDEIDAAGYRIIDTGPRLRRLPRMITGGWRMYSAVSRARPSVVHFHDPELLPWALLIGLAGTKVVYDAHEDTPRQVQHNPRLPIWIRKVLPPFVALIEWLAVWFFSAVVAATPEIAKRFPRNKAVLVQNYPLIHEFDRSELARTVPRERAVAYIGGLTRARGVFTMVDAMERLDDPTVSLRLAGEFVIDDDQTAVSRSLGWKFVRYEGLLDRTGVSDLLSQVRAGLVTLYPIRNYIEARPVKLFEYMAAGLPVIASDFPRWREIVSESQCGLLVDPTDPEAIASAINWILEHPYEADAMGQRGREAVLTRYSWSPEEQKLIALYRDLLNRNDAES